VYHEELIKLLDYYEKYIIAHAGVLTGKKGVIISILLKNQYARARDCRLGTKFNNYLDSD
jgi:hypothetical protein